MVETGFLDFPCTLCNDFGMWLTPKGDVQPCPVIARGGRHNVPNAAALMVHKAIAELKRNAVKIDSRLFELTRLLSTHSSDRPCFRKQILEDYFSYLPMTEHNQLRKFHAAIEELRRVWMLPIGSRKESPSGYWIITDVKDFEEWITRSKSAPTTQLTTIYRVARRNFPIFAEQMELEFWNDVQADDFRPAA
jgi:hypothetical protein